MNDGDRVATNRARPRRRFGLLDAMILVAASAFGLFWLRAETAPEDAIYLIFRGRSPLFSRIIPAQRFFMVMYPLLIPLTVAQVWLRARRPRPSWTRVMRQPGLVACLAASASILGYGLDVLAQWVTLVTLNSSASTVIKWSFIDLYVAGMGAHAATAGMGVVVGWLVLGLSCRWRAEPGWVDRMGRVLGVAWIVAIPCQIALEQLWPLGAHGVI